MTTPAVSPGLSLYAKAVVCASFVLIFIGGLVTSSGAGMAVPDWPLSFGSVNPAGWWRDAGVRLEHGHRLFAAFDGLLIVILGVWIWREPGARNLRTLSLIAVAGVILQGIFGGLRVRLETGGDPHGAMALRIIHGCVAQAEVCLVVALATMLSPRWHAWPSLGPLPTRFAWITAGVVYVQLIFGAAMRHLGAGLAIPTWPAANPEGGFMPKVHGPYTDTNFTHTRFGAIAVTILILLLAHRVHRAAAGEPRLTRPAWVLLALVLIQFSLGVLVIWHGKPATLTTFHVANGALVLATTVFLALRLSRAAAAQSFALPG